MEADIGALAKKLRDELDQKVVALKALPAMTEILKLQDALNGLERLIDQPETSLSQLFGLGSEGGSKAALTAWEFTGMKPLEAAKHYLSKMKEPRTIDDIVETIRNHGGDPGSIDHLKTSLTRSTFDVVKVSEDMYGPIGAFPHIKRSGKKKRGAVSNSEADAASEIEDEISASEEEDSAEK